MARGYTAGEQQRAQAQAANPGSALDGQLAALRTQINQLSNATGIDGAAARNNLVNRYNSLLQQKQQMSAQTSAQGSANTAKAEAEAARKKILGTAQGGIDRLNSDPTDKLFRDYLQGQMGAQVLDPNAKPFEGGAPQYSAQTMQAQQGQAAAYNPERMTAQTVNFRDPFDQQTIGAMVNEQAAGAGAAESARNQLMRDAVLASGGNAFDPSLRAAQAESMAQRQSAVASARNQINMVANRENAATQNAAAAQNANYGQQAGQFNAMAGNQAGQFNAANQQQASFNNAQMAQQAGQFNAGAQNQAGMFNVGNQMQAQNANFNAGQQSRMYNQGVQSGAAGQLGQYNNQRQGMLSDAEGRLIDVTGRQVFRGPETQMRLPNFQQFSGGGGGNMTSGVTYAPGYFGSAIQSGGTRAGYGNPSGTAPVWAGSGRTPQGSGTTTTSFQNGYTGTPFYQQASQYVNRTPTQQQQPSIWAGGTQQRQMPGTKQPIMNPNQSY